MSTVYGKRYEDYIKVIYKIQKEKNSVRLKDVAKALNLKPPTVLQYINKLSQQGMVIYSKGEIKLTKEGEKFAKRLERQYDILERFLSEVLGLSKEKASLEACYAEHGFSEETIRRIEILLDFFKSDGECAKRLKTRFS